MRSFKNPLLNLMMVWFRDIASELNHTLQKGSRLGGGGGDNFAYKVQSPNKRLQFLRVHDFFV